MVTEGKNLSKYDENTALRLKWSVFRVYYTAEKEETHDLAGIWIQGLTAK